MDNEEKVVVSILTFMVIYVLSTFSHLMYTYIDNEYEADGCKAFCPIVNTFTGIWLYVLLLLKPVIKLSKELNNE